MDFHDDFNNPDHNLYLTCTIKDFMHKTYGKQGGEFNGKQIVMELKYHFDLLAEALPEFLIEQQRKWIGGSEIPQEFYDWLRVDHRSFDFSDQFFYTLPEPRYSVYETSSYTEMQNEILGLTGELVEAMGFYQMNTEFDLL